MSKNRNNQFALRLAQLKLDPAFVLVLDFLKTWMSQDPQQPDNATQEAMALWEEPGSNPDTRFSACLLTCLGRQTAIGMQMLNAAKTAHLGTGSAEDAFYRSLASDPLRADEIADLKRPIAQEKFDACLALYIALYAAENAPWAKHVLTGGIHFRVVCYSYQLAQFNNQSVVAVESDEVEAPVLVIKEVVSLDQIEMPETIAAAIATPATPVAQPHVVTAVTTELEKEKETMSQAYKAAEAAVDAVVENTATKITGNFEMPRTPAPSFPSYAPKSEGLMMKSAKVVGYTMAGAVAVAVGVTAARYVAARYDLSFNA